MMPTHRRPDNTHATWGDTLRRRADTFRRQTRRRFAIELLARMFGIGIFIWLMLLTTQLLVGLGCAALVTGVAVGLADLLEHRPFAAIPTSGGLVEVAAIHRATLERQRDRFLGSWRRSVAPLLPGITLFFLVYGTLPLPGRIAACAAASILGNVACRRSARAAARLQAEVDALPEVHLSTARWEARR